MTPRRFAAHAVLGTAVLLAACSPAPEAHPGAGAPGSSVTAPSPMPPGTGGTATPPAEVSLDSETRALLAQARRFRQPVVILLVTPTAGRSGEAVAGLEGLGGIVATGEQGRLRVSLPTQHVERAAALPGVHTVKIDQLPPPDAHKPYGSTPSGPH
ncbi:MAG: hypothetical protein ACRDT0_16555 [Pseudonocardiaceae bacterium]